MYKNIYDKLKDGPLKISIIGCGNWASAISKVVGTNAKNNYLFENEVKMWVKSENSEELANIINEKHENVKYLKGVTLPDNIVGYTDIVEVVNGADLLIFNIPCQFMENVLTLIHQNKSIQLGKHVQAISLTKGFIVKDNRISLCSKEISEFLNIPCSALSGANIAIDVAMEKFSEATIGGDDKYVLLIWQRLFDLPYFKVECVNISAGVEICGSLKNIITLAAGFCDGLNASPNSKSAIIRIGINETKLFAEIFFNYFCESIYFQSCGFADIITSFLGGRNSKCSVEFIKHKQKKSWEELESEILDGQKLQGTVTLKYVYHMICEKNLTKKFPLFTILHKIAFEKEEPLNLFKIFMNNKVATLKL